MEPFFPSGYHKKQVTNIACSQVKSLYATCAMDKTIKFWSYQDDMRGLFTMEFDAQPNCITMHPSGLFMAIAF